MAAPPAGSSLPVLDPRDLASPATAAVFERAAFERALLAATRDIGFFYLVGVPLGDLRERMLAQARAFFALPEREKREIDMANSPHLSGYTRVGVGGERTRGRADQRETLDVWPERAAHSRAELARMPAYARLPGPNQWPRAVPALRRVVDEWRAAVGAAAHLLLRAWARALGQSDDYFDRHFAHPTTRMKIVRYPAAVQGADRAGNGDGNGDGGDEDGGYEGALGVGAHKDGGCVTLLWVQPGVGGLQVWRRGAWADVAPAPDAGFVCNIGEMVELATNGYLRATVHRVVPGARERISVPMFFNPGLDARLPRIELPEELRREVDADVDADADAAGSSASADTTHDDHIFETYGDNLLKSRLRAHPDVAQRWYADLLREGQDRQ